MSSVGSTAGEATARTPGVATRYYRRFDRVERLMHAFLMFSFIGCALTGLPLLFADRAWAPPLVRLMGGFEIAGIVHRVCAAVMIVLLVGHVVRVFARALARSNLLAILWGPDSLVPQPQDVVDIYRHFKWFLGKGPRPEFDRFTYWEKFDYWAVFWGMFIIGGSGLLLWFPMFFSNFMPGWVFNIATLVHGEEALLAVGFIFTIHFFNGHLRPEKFPMDLVIFTGRVSEHEMRDERQVEYARLVQQGRLAAQEAAAPTSGIKMVGRIVGGTALTLGIVTIALIIYSALVR
jgi:cytochrome b subunit of formate dehydrogenase